MIFGEGKGKINVYLEEQIYYGSSILECLYGRQKGPEGFSAFRAALCQYICLFTAKSFA